MQGHTTESATLLRLWAWFETNKKQVVLGAVVIMVIGLIAWFFVWRSQEHRIAAGQALSEVFVPQAMSGGASVQTETAGYLKVASEYPNSPAGAQAQLMAAANLFIERNYPKAQEEFEKFVRDNPNSPLRSQGLLGIATCLDAQGKTTDAITAYKNLIDRFPAENVVEPARFALARLYETQNKPELAFPLYDQIARNDPYGALGSEAGMRYEELKLEHPELAPPPPGQTNAASFTPAQTLSLTSAVLPRVTSPAGMSNAVPLLKIPAAPQTNAAPEVTVPSAPRTSAAPVKPAPGPTQTNSPTAEPKK